MSREHDTGGSTPDVDRADRLDPELQRLFDRAYDEELPVDVGARHLWALYRAARTPVEGLAAAPRPSNLRRRLANATLGVFVFLLPGLLGQVSVQALPGEFLYAVKRHHELVKLETAISWEARDKLLAEQAEQRLLEAQAIARTSPRDVAHVVADAADVLEALRQSPVEASRDRAEQMQEEASTALGAMVAEIPASDVEALRVAMEDLADDDVDLQNRGRDLAVLGPATPVQDSTGVSGASGLPATERRTDTVAPSTATPTGPGGERQVALGDARASQPVASEPDGEPIPSPREGPTADPTAAPSAGSEPEDPPGDASSPEDPQGADAPVTDECDPFLGVVEEQPSNSPSAPSTAAADPCEDGGGASEPSAGEGDAPSTSAPPSPTPGASDPPPASETPSAPATGTPQEPESADPTSTPSAAPTEVPRGLRTPTVSPDPDPTTPGPAGFPTESGTTTLPSPTWSPEPTGTPGPTAPELSASTPSAHPATPALDPGSATADRTPTAAPAAG